MHPREFGKEKLVSEFSYSDFGGIMHISWRKRYMRITKTNIVINIFTHKLGKCVPILDLGVPEKLKRSTLEL